MNSFQRILCPTDFGSCAHAALQQALQLAEAYDAKVDLLHVASVPEYFARDDRAFAEMLEEMWRVLAPGGLFFARLATSIGLERQLSSSTGRVRLPDGSERFVVDERTLLDWTSRLGGTLADPLKTTNVQNARCMTTWVMQK